MAVINNWGNATHYYRRSMPRLSGTELLTKRNITPKRF
jgi:hypothetical protein